MWIITYKGKPVTLEKIYKIEELVGISYLNSNELDSYVSANTSRHAKELFLSHIGGEWAERKAGIKCQKAVVVK